MKKRICRKLLFPIVIVLIISSFLYGQQKSPYTQYDVNLMYTNPAYTGSQGGLSIAGLFRHQWIGAQDLNGAPTTYTLMADVPFSDYKMGVGGSITYDQIGPFQNMIINGSYSYKFEFGGSLLAKRGRRKSRRFKRKNIAETNYIALGLDISVMNLKADMNSLLIFDPDDASFTNNKLNTFIPNFGLGFAVKTGLFYGGVSASNILAQSFDKNNPLSLAKTRVNLYGNFGLTLAFSESFTLLPSVLLRFIESNPLQLNAYLKFNLLDRVYFGIIYRSLNQVSFTGQVVVKEGITIGYAHDLATSDLERTYHYGSHEFSIRYTKGDFKSASKKRKTLTPKFRR